MVGPPPPHILEQELTTELLLYDESQQLFVSLNETASDVWRMASGEFTIDEIVTKLASSYKADPSTVRKDVARVVDDLVEKKLIPAPE